MPISNPPDYSEVIEVPRWSNGSDIDGPYGLKRVTRDKDEIAAADINQLRNYIETMWNHRHEYTDDTGC